jgi:hypothetical protein
LANIRKEKQVITKENSNVQNLQSLQTMQKPHPLGSMGMQEMEMS